MFRLIIDRESVCIGDDVEDHRITMDVGDEMDFRQLLSRLRSIGYFPYVHGNDVVWVMVYGDDTELIAYQTKDGCEYTTFLDAVPLIASWLDDKEGKFCFRYFSSREKRALDIFRRCGSNNFHIWHEGYLNEYRSYQISKDQEERWRENFRLS